ncbi:MAG: hypothetical protein ACRC39_01620 [Enterobacter sp.]
MATSLPFLNEEQKEKIVKLEKELKEKQEYEEKNKHRKEETSKLTGLPIDVIDMDVVKMGIFLGLIQKNNSNNTRKNNTLLKLLLGDEEQDIDKTKFPSHFRNAPQYVQEQKKMQFISHHVQKQSEFYAELINNIINDSLKQVQKCIEINLQQKTLQDFKTVVQDILEITVDELLENEQNSEEDWNTMNTLRKTLLGPLNVCEYKKVVFEIFSRLYKAGKNYNIIIDSLSTIEKRIILFPGCISRDTLPFNFQDAYQLKNELLIRYYNKDPKMIPFHFNNILQQCCTPLLLMVPINIVLTYSLLNPYLTNPIIYLKLDDTNGAWSFYILDNIIDEKIRLWVLDIKLFHFIDMFRFKILKYLIKIFKTFYFECFQTNRYIVNFFENKNHGDVFVNILKNIKLVCDFEFVDLIQNLVQHNSFIIPTQYDFFNQIVYSKVEEYKNINPDSLFLEMFETNHVEKIFHHF